MREIISGQEDTATGMTDLEFSNAATTNDTTTATAAARTRPVDETDDGHNTMLIESVECELESDDEPAREGESRFYYGTHTLQLVVITKNDRNNINNENVQNVLFKITKDKGLKWNLSCFEPFTRNVQRIEQIYSKKLFWGGWSASSVRVIIIMMMEAAIITKIPEHLAMIVFTRTKTNKMFACAQVD